MNSFFLHSNGENLMDRSDFQIEAESQPIHSISEGSEFLDDALRMKEMPLISSEEKVDIVGTPNQF